MKNYKLLGIDTNPKTALGREYGYATGILYLAPHESAYKVFKQGKRAFTKAFNNRYDQKLKTWEIEKLLSGINICPWAETCQKDCLNTSGRGGMDSTQFYRALKTTFYRYDKLAFIGSIEREIFLANRNAKKQGLKLAIRLNGTSDISISCKLLDKWDIDFPDVRFYDYTKRPSQKSTDRYNITYSIQSKARYDMYIQNKHFNTTNGAIVTLKGIDDPILDKLPTIGLKLVDGNKHDLRFLDPKKALIVLKYKKVRAKTDDNSQFIVNNWEL